MLKSTLKRLLILILALNTAAIGFPSFVLASPISTQVVIQMDERQAHIDRIRAAMAREDVRNTMIGMGVDPVEAELRVDALTLDELVMLERQIESLPAGGVLEVLGVVLVVLIILEVLGITNIFTHL
ncbi:MAG: PA2779 family protein [Candidatus Thiodiazotropha sp. (ex Dulcina madagascariensis)]|nr:PA2779 family protein [Candidatus Thiodiazotropha sp. (ex Epidulcina cf. delphinae)]MCU7924356.1 PA2779 family protein [Candidatus Thiodiazotropha sp. (ex Dulcina madagascariensis)]MCU7925986.1 PA2779 family protein [Candidatus Thiodiazotropha sp. (ex Dulcina madagascariensis)]